jgi:peptidyl-prolyl cis-trans isomerase A (cyclophilin A)
MSNRILSIVFVFAMFQCHQVFAGPQQAAGRAQEEKKMQNEKQPTPKPAVNSAALLDPSKATEHAPATFRVKLETTKGPVVLEVVRDWAPNGADRFYNLVKIGFYNDVAFFRVIDGFMAQFGIHGDPKVAAKWREARIADDPVKQSNLRGFVSFATAGPNTRTTQLFINYADRNAQLDRSGFAPFARVIQGMEVVDSLYSGYGEGAPNGAGPNQGLVQMQGNAYLRANFPKLDYIKTATIVE